MATFAGDKKVGESVFGRIEKVFVRKFVDRVPKGLETYHLTMMTVLWSALTLGFGYLSKANPMWLAGVSVMVALQYLTDLFDGAVGRHRDTGLVKWGYYMDHFLDYIFTCSVIGAYAIAAPAGVSPAWFMALLAIAGGFMVNSFLAFAATNRFEIYFYGVGPTEFRALLIAMNTALLFIGLGHFTWTVPTVCVISAIALVALVYRTHRQLWAIDMEAKTASDGKRLAA